MRKFLFFVWVSIFAVNAIASTATFIPTSKVVESSLNSTSAIASTNSSIDEAKDSKVKNIILLIGDGMGAAQVGLLETYAQNAPNSIYAGEPTSLQALASQGKTVLSMTSVHNAIVADSACSASQLATGVACRSEMIGLDINGDPVETVLEQAKRMGKSTGLVSDTRITHATPAAFAAHQAHRDMEAAIAEDLIKNRVDVLFSGGLSFFLPNKKDLITATQLHLIYKANLNTKSRRKDKKNLLTTASNKGYQLAFSNMQLHAIKQTPVLGLFNNSVMVDALTERDDVQRTYPSLQEMTVKALQLLEQNDNGFFLMVESGQIDWTAHNNDAGGLLHEMLRMDDTLKSILNWGQDRDDTLIVVTGDHETGGFGFSYSNAEVPAASKLTGAAFKKKYFSPDYNFAPMDLLDKLYAQKKGTYSLWHEAIENGKEGRATTESLMAAVNDNMEFKITKEQADRVLKVPAKIQDFSDFYVYEDEKPLNLLGRELAVQQNVVWSTGTHTASPVPVFVLAPEAIMAKFNGIMTHRQIGTELKNSFK